ncbi:MAG: DUF167 domain-containing protein [Pseudomonadota bacterium]
MAGPERPAGDSSPSTLLEVSVQPRSSREGLFRGADGGLRIYVTAAPVDGAANDAVLRVLSRALKLPKSRLSLERGHTSRRKLIKITGVGPEDVEVLLPPPAAGTSKER